MTVVTGNIRDIGMAPLSGSLEARSAEFRASGDVLIAPEARAFPVVAGAVEADLLPGPVRVTISVGSHARETFDVIVPESGPVTLARLVEDAVEWSPQVVSAVAAHRQAAEQAAAEAAASAADAAADAQVVGSAAQDMSAQVSAAQGHAQAAAGSASSAASSATGAESSAVAASGSASGAASSASAAEGSAGAAAGSASAAAGSAQDAASSAAEAESSAQDAAGSAQSAEQWATSFDVTASSATLAPGSQATVTVTGDGPAYHLEMGVPQGDEGPKGDPGEVSQAALDSALSGKADLVDGKLPAHQLPAIAVTEFLGAVDSQSDMLTLAGQEGDWCIRTDTQTTHVITGPDPSQGSSWTQLVHPSDAVSSVAGRTGAVTLAVADVGGLQAALDGKAATSHTHTTADVTGLDSALAGKANATHTHTTAQVTGLDAALAGKASSTHTHTPASLGAVARSGSATTLWSGTAAQYAALAEATKNAAGFIAVITG